MAIGVQTTPLPTRGARIQQIIDGARNGELNESEFGTLNQLGNDISFAQSMEDTRCQCHGNSPDLQNMKKQYQRTYEQFRHGDFHPTVPDETPYERAAGRGAANVYRNIQDGGSGNYQALDQQRQIMTTAGSRVATDKGWTPESSAQTLDQFRGSLATQMR